MVTQQTSPQALDVAELTSRAETYLALAADGAAQREREAELPGTLLAELAELRLGTFRVPAAFGGPGGSVGDVIGFIVALAAVDATLALALRPHFGAVESLVHDASQRAQRQWFPRVLAGELLGLGTTGLHAVAVSTQEIVEHRPPTGARGAVSTFQQLFLAAVEAGIACNALTDAVWFTQKRSRPIKHSSASRSVDDPYIRRTVGEIAARAYAAEATVRAAAAALDRVLQADGDDDGSLTDAAVEVAQAQFMAAELALKSAELIFDVGGGSATAREHNLDRHWRNARTVASRHPRDYKASVIGDYRLSGTEPPASGLF